MSAGLGRALLCLCAIAGACGGSEHRASSGAGDLLARAPTPGDELWRKVPAGADLMLEVDLSRLRANAHAGPVLEVISPPEALRESDLLQKAESLLVAVYDIGVKPRQLIVLQGARLQKEGQASTEAQTLTIGDPELVRLAEGLQESSPTMAEDRKLWRLRSRPMPEQAKAAAFRMVARLDFDTRVAIASKLALSDVPISMTVWADVVDDLAIVAHLESEDIGQSERLERGLLALRTRLSRMRFFRYLAIAPALRNMRVTRSATSVRLVFVLSPKRLHLVAARLLQELQAGPSQSATETQPQSPESHP